MSYYKFDVDLDTETANYFANNVAHTDLGFTLAKTRTVDGAAHKVTITGIAATDHSAKTFTLVGTDQNGNPQSEGVAGPNGTATVTSTKYFGTLTGVTVSSSTSTDEFDIGFADEVMSPHFPLPYHTVALPVQVDIVGTINYGVQVTLGSPNDAAALWVADGNVTNETSDQLDYLSKYGLAQVRFVVNSYSAGAEIHGFLIGR